MPTYEYEVIQPDGSPGERFEVFQSMSDAPLTKHPETGEPVRRVLSAPRIMGKWSDHKMKKAVSDDRKLDQMGFTKYVKSGKGTYETRAGKGPNTTTPE